MFPRNKFLFPSLTSISHLFVIIYVFAIICQTNLCLSQECLHITDCKCAFNNGSIIDLSSLGESFDNKPVWENMKPSLQSDNNTYSYNPCHKFSLGSGDCNNVEVCLKRRDGAYINVGSQAFPQWNNQKHVLSLMYTTPTTITTNRTTIVMLVCRPDAIKPTFEVIGEKKPSTYEMNLYSRCACADLCARHLSAGSVLVILFLIFVSLYLILGIIHSSLTRGAHGWELIPNYEFWMDFPLLVRDGCVFVMSGCKPETAYERI